MQFLFSRRDLIAIFSTLVAGAFSITTWASPGDFDASFGGGVVTPSRSPISDTKIALSRDNSIVYQVFPCINANSQSTFCVLVVDRDGTFISSNFGPAVSLGMGAVSDVAVDPNSGALIAMASCKPFSASPRGICITRFLSNGEHDPSFGTGGTGYIVRTPDRDSPPGRLAIASDSTIYATFTVADGTVASPTSSVRINAFTAAGQTNTTFSNGSVALPRVLASVGTTSNNDVAGDIIVLPNGTVLVFYTCPEAGGISRVCVANFNRNGTLTAAVSRLATLTAEEANRVFLVAPESGANTYRLLAASIAPVTNGTSPFLRKFTIVNGAFGAYLSGWGTSPQIYPGLSAPFNAGFNSSAWREPSFHWGIDKRLYIASCDGGDGISCETTVRRLDTSGAEYDRTWGADGAVNLTGQSATTRRTSMQTQGDGKLVIGGQSTILAGNVRLVRLENDTIAAARCTMDIDGDGVVLPTTDGLLMARVSAGLSGNAVTTGALGGNAIRSSWPAIRNYLAITCSMKVAP
ncbi:MAG: hypothetical protein EAZ21_08180 [Betaproteobacteria bacterium]|nr:MAG: hypothetical protein EAZ21_08180 [Betaproteobacteria bacterium]